MLLSGYGDRAFSTLRCKFDLGPDTVTIRENAIWSPYLESAGVCLDGRSEKRAAGEDKGVRLTLGDMTPEEALFLAKRFMDYAILPHHKFRRLKPGTRNWDYVPIEKDEA